MGKQVVMPSTASKVAWKSNAQNGESPAVPSPALEWLWKYLSDVPHPHILDCGKVKPQTVDLLLRRGSKIFVADLVSTVQRVNPMLWDRSKKVPVFLVDDFLAQMPPIPPSSLNAVFCWHLLDLIPREALLAVMDRLFLSLQGGGVLFFLLREPYLQKGADSIWWLEGLTTLCAGGDGNKSFPFSPVTGRDVEKFLPAGNLKSFLTRSGRREVLVLK
ncbi:MAG TPA: hypothetical protein VG028_02500 [Terriglobia bacterium]|nr:hypothetical protein [Terriglobia bacterium]